MSQRNALTASDVLASASTVVVKLGSSLLVDPDSSSFRSAWFATLVEDLTERMSAGARVIVVSSGAIALGCQVTGSSRASQTLVQNQASAAIGQIRLAREFEQAFARHELQVAQVLLTLDDTEQRRRYLNARHALEAILEMGVVPFINENDTVATSEIRFGDNDRLAARVAQMMSADCLVLLSDIQGLYDADPREMPGAAMLERVDAISPSIVGMAGAPGSSLGSGGMVTKIDAARIAVDSGCHMILSSGLVEHPVRAVLAGTPCTLFTATDTPVRRRKQWINGSLQRLGRLVIDEGAVQALRVGGSLLAVGVLQVEGDFLRGDAVSLVDTQGQELGCGLSAYDSEMARRIAGSRSQEIKRILGFAGPDALIHRDDLVLASGH